MREKIISAFIFSLFVVDNFCLANSDSERIKTNPAAYLDPQDVPIFYQGNPLKGLHSFAVIPPCSVQSQEVLKKITDIIEEELGSIGIVMKMKSEDVTGFGGSLLNIQIGRASKWEGGELPISRVSLHIETPVIIRKTKVKSCPRVWSINNFIDSPLDSKSEDQVIGAIQNLLREFVQTYQLVNLDPKTKPTFYLY